MLASLESRRILAFSVLGGLLAGGILSAALLTIVQPYMNAIADIILDELLSDGEYDEDEFDEILQRIRVAQLGGSIATGLAAGALIGTTGVLSGKVKTSYFWHAIIIAAIAWFVLYVVPTVKYPPSPYAIFDAEAASAYFRLYIAYTAVSGLSALSLAAISRRIANRNKVFAMAALYLLVIAIAFFVFPEYRFDSSFPQVVLDAWRASISAAITLFWFSAGLFCGLLWTYAARKTPINTSA